MRDVSDVRGNQSAICSRGGVSRREALAAGLGVLAVPLLSQLGMAAPPAAAGDWTSFRNGPQLLGLSGTTLPDRPEVRWTLDAPDGIAATAAIVGERVYVADLSGRLRCVDLGTGNVFWTYNSVEKVAANTFAPGFKASPTVTSELIYLGDEDGVFHAVDTATGTRRWTYETGGEIISSATLSGDVVLFGSYDNALYCLDRVTGAKRWEVVTEGYVHCTPAVDEGHTFIAGCDERLRVIEIATGTVKVDLPIGTYLIASPALRDGQLYFGTYAASVVCVDWRKAATVWSYSAGRELPFQGSAAVTDELVIVGGRDKVVHAIDRNTGTGVWTFQTRSRVDSSPAVCGGRVYVGSSDHFLYCLDLKTGTEVWKQSIGGPVTASPAVGAGVIVIGGENANGTLYCLGAK